MTDTHDFGARLREAREARSLTQLELSQRSGVDRSYLSKLETGQTPPTAKLIRRLAGALGVRHPWLADGTGHRDLDAHVPMLRELLDSGRLSDEEKVVLGNILEAVWRAGPGITLRLTDNETALVLALRRVSPDVRAVVEGGLRTTDPQANIPPTPPSWWPLLAHLFELRDLYSRQLGLSDEDWSTWGHLIDTDLPDPPEADSGGQAPEAGPPRPPHQRR